MNSRLTLAMGVLASLAIGCRVAPAHEGRQSQSAVMERKAEQALEELRQAYMARDLNGFFERVSESSYFNGSDLRVKLSRQFTDFSDLELSFWIDHALAEGKKVVVRMHWQKRMTVNKTGRQATSSGRSDFIFEVRESAQLLDIQGSSPFAV